MKLEMTVGKRRAALTVVMAQVLRDEESIFLCSAEGHVIHFPVEQINILSGVGKGVMGIKLAEGDRCLGGALISSRFDVMQVETAGGKVQEFRRGKYELTSRGGKGFEAVKRTTFVRVLPPAIELVDWEQIEGNTQDQVTNGKRKGQQRELFE